MVVSRQAREEVSDMFLEQRSVSRKTPLDGKLEISPAAAERLTALGSEFLVVSGGREASGHVQSMPCTCARGAGSEHVHHFVESTVLKELAAGAEVRLEMDEASGVVRVD
jgi:hypothetical protein